MKQEHKYAQVLRWIADGEIVQWQAGNGSWELQCHAETLDEISSQRYGVGRYRIAPKTIKIGNREVEAPIVNPHEGQRVWRWAATLGDADSFVFTADKTAMDNAAKAGMFFETEAAARAAHEAITALVLEQCK